MVSIATAIETSSSQRISRQVNFFVVLSVCIFVQVYEYFPEFQVLNFRLKFTR